MRGLATAAAAAALAACACGLRGAAAKPVISSIWGPYDKKLADKTTDSAINAANSGGDPGPEFEAALAYFPFDPDNMANVGVSSMRQGDNVAAVYHLANAHYRVLAHESTIANVKLALASLKAQKGITVRLRPWKGNAFLGTGFALSEGADSLQASPPPGTVTQMAPLALTYAALLKARLARKQTRLGMCSAHS